MFSSNFRIDCYSKALICSDNVFFNDLLHDEEIHRAEENDKGEYVKDHGGIRSVVFGWLLGLAELTGGRERVNKPSFSVQYIAPI